MFTEIANKFYKTFIFEDRYLFFVRGLKMTLLLTAASFILGVLLGVAFCALRRCRSAAVRKITEILVHFFVQLPTMVLLMVFVYIIFGSSALSITVIVIFGLTIKAGAYLSEVFCTALDTVSPGEIEAARTLGMTAVQTFFHVTLPQAVSAGLPLLKNQFISTMQETSVVGYLAVMDLTRASNVVTMRTMDALFGLIMVSAIYIVLGYIGQALLNLLGIRRHIGG